MSLQIKNLASPGAVEVDLFDEISMWGANVGEVARQIRDISAEEIVVRLNSPGGDVFEGLAIMNVLRAHPAHVTCVVEGLAASAASVIAVGGADRVVMRPQAELMIHDAWTFASGDAAELLKLVGQLDRTSDNLAQIYAAKAGGSVEQWRRAMRDETWFSAQEALEHGLIDAVEDSAVVGDAAAVKSGGGLVAAFGAVRRFNFARRGDAPAPRVHETKKEDQLVNFQAIAVRLGLREDASEGEVLAALDAALAPEDEVPVPDKKVRECEEKVAAAEAALAAAVADLEAAKSCADAEGDTVPDANGEGSEPEKSEAPLGALPAASAASSLVVTVDAGALQELQKLAAYGAQARDRDQAAARAEKVDQAIAENRISSAARSKWLRAMEANEDDVTAALNSIPKNTIPRVELGHGLGEEQSTNPTLDVSSLIKPPNL